jgi:hypothetical protein
MALRIAVEEERAFEAEAGSLEQRLELHLARIEARLAGLEARLNARMPTATNSERPGGAEQL